MNQNRFLLLFLLALFTGFVSHSAQAASAVAELRGTNPNSPVRGTVYLQEVSGGLNITVNVENVPPGMHGFHIHEFGACGNLGMAAGGHFNPLNVAHGYFPTQGNNSAHVGDLGNLSVDATGTGIVQGFVPGLNLTSGLNNVSGRAFILHASADDFSQPLGNAGARIGCGPIVIVSQ